jgi:hypothetical protein
MAIPLADEDQIALAKQKNQQALALFDELATPVPSLGKERAKALILRDMLKKDGAQ